MVIPEERRNMMRVTVTLDPLDVDLLDRLAKLEGETRSHELRTLLAQLRPVLRATVEAFEAASRARDQLDFAAAQATLSELQQMLPEAEKMHASYLGAAAKLEGLATAAELAHHKDDPRPSNHGGHTPTPPATPTPPEVGTDS
jgi:hypothetical protein